MRGIKFLKVWFCDYAWAHVCYFPNFHSYCQSDLMTFILSPRVDPNCKKPSVTLVLYWYAILWLAKCHQEHISNAMLSFLLKIVLKWSLKSTNKKNNNFGILPDSYSGDIVDANNKISRKTNVDGRFHLMDRDLFSWILTKKDSINLITSSSSNEIVCFMVWILYKKP